MLPKSYRVFKWLVYAAATLLLCGVQSLLCNNLRVFGVTPFLYPLLPAMVAMFEGTRPGAVFGLVLGIFCDLLVPAPFRGFFTIAFPAAAVFAAGIASRLLSRGVLCALVVSAAGLLTVCAFRLAVQVLSGGQYLGLMARISLAETLLTLPFVLAALPVYRSLFRKCAADY